MWRLFRRTSRSPIGRPCRLCGSPAQFGYGQHAEEALEKLEPLCIDCLQRRIGADYGAFKGRAVIVEPAAGPPVYVYQPLPEWKAQFPNSKVAGDVEGLLDRMSSGCEDCGESACFVGVGSLGLTAINFGDVLDQGLAITLLKNSPPPRSVCSRCCVRRIAESLKRAGPSYIEVCSPSGTANGFVMPMGY